MIAYLDANSGSMIASAIAAGFAGIAVVFKLGWGRTIGFFSPKHRRAAKEALAGERSLRPRGRRHRRSQVALSPPAPVEQ